MHILCTLNGCCQPSMSLVCVFTYSLIFRFLNYFYNFKFLLPQLTNDQIITICVNSCSSNSSDQISVQYCSPLKGPAYSYMTIIRLILGWKRVCYTIDVCTVRRASAVISRTKMHPEWDWGILWHQYMSGHWTSEKFKLERFNKPTAVLSVLYNSILPIKCHGTLIRQIHLKK